MKIFNVFVDAGLANGQGYLTIKKFERKNCLALESFVQLSLQRHDVGCRKLL